MTRSEKIEEAKRLRSEEANKPLLEEIAESQTPEQWTTSSKRASVLIARAAVLVSSLDALAEDLRELGDINKLNEALAVYFNSPLKSSVVELFGQMLCTCGKCHNGQLAETLEETLASLDEISPILSAMFGSPANMVDARGPAESNSKTVAN